MGKVKFTPKQQMVIDARNTNLLVAAAAGSGKTAVLTNRIISLISDSVHPIDIDHLLIVTFTKAAAAEMRERIGNEIDNWLEEHPNDQNMQRQQTLLHNAQITTIDSFCLFVIRNNFAEIGLDPGFRPMDEGERCLMMKDVLSEIMNAHYEKNAETGDPEFVHLLDCYCDNGKEDELEKQILAIYELAMSNPFPMDWISQADEAYKATTMEELSEHSWWKECNRLSEIYMREAYSLAKKGVDICMESGGPEKYKATMQAQADYAKELLKETDYDRRYRILKNMDVPAFQKISAKDMVDPLLKEQVTNYRNQVKKIFGDLKDKYYMYDSKFLLESNAYIKRAASEIVLLVSEFIELFTKRKREKNLIDFSDMEHLALDILLTKDESGNVEPTNVAKEYQEYFAEVMVDEYQDSNYVQEYILQSVSNGQNYFMVGDVKQSIYRFRLARPEIFMGKYENYQDLSDTEDSKLNVSKIDLNQNFRSRLEVLESVNDVFEQIMKSDVAGMDYDEAARLHLGASFPEAKAKEYQTELLILDKDEFSNNKKVQARIKKKNVDVMEAESEMDAEDGVDACEAEGLLVASEIRKMIRGGYEVTDKKTGELRPVCYKDIVVLVRSAGTLAECIRHSLEECGIPAYLAAKTGYFSTMEIKTILNFLKVIDNPRQDIPLYGTLLSIIGGFTEEELAELKAGNKKKCLYDILVEQSEDSSKIEEFLILLNRYRKLAAYTTIHDLLQLIFDETGYMNYMSAFPGGMRRQANLYMLLEKASAFEQTSYHGLFHFIRYINLLKEQSVDYGEAGVLDENADVVRIMTIHKSKGLEFPICFLAGMGKNMNKKDASKNILADATMGLGLDLINPQKRIKMAGSKKKMMGEKILLDSLAEEMRILYVAMTRAKEKLIMTGAVGSAVDILEAPQEDNIAGKILHANTYMDLILVGYVAAGKAKKYAKIVQMDDLIEDEIADQLEENYREKDLLQKEACQTEIYNILKKQMEFCYAYPELEGLYTKTTVTELKKAAYEDEQAHTMFEDEKENAYIPKFAREEVETSAGTRRGTAYHRIMELIPYKEINEKTKLKAFVENVIEQRVAQHYILREDAELVDVKKCVKFLKSDLAGRMIAADKDNKLFKEKPFFMGIPAKEIKDSFLEKEYILVQGVIDAYFQEADGIVIMDYKTDRVSSEEELVKRYQKQLEIYARAVYQITGIPVKETKIYSFSLGKEIVVSNNQ